MILGVVAPNGLPTFEMDLAGQTWTCIIDTGFSGDLEIPDPVRSFFGPVFFARILSHLAAGQGVYEDVFLVDFPFDGEILSLEAVFTPDQDILVGAGALRDYRLVVDYPAETVRLERLRPPTPPHAFP